MHDSPKTKQIDMPGSKFSAEERKITFITNITIQFVNLFLKYFLNQLKVEFLQYTEFCLF